MRRDVAARRLGRLSAEERTRAVFDDGVYEGLETVGVAAATRARAEDGFIAAVGLVHGRRALVLASDRRIARGTYGPLVSRVIVRGVAYARDAGMPVVLLLDSDGVRVEDGIESVFGVGELLRALADTSGYVPMLAGILGVASGAAAYAAALCDLTVAVTNRSFAFVAGPAVVGAAIGQQTGLDALGGTRLHASESGVLHATAPDDGAVIATLRAMLSYLPPSASESPRPAPSHAPSRGTDLASAFPEDRRYPYDVRVVIEHLVDAGSYLALSSPFGPSIETGFARIAGRAIGLVASQPRANSGAIDASASQKLARFVRLCAAFNLPVVTLCDTPGFLPGRQSEQSRILVHGAKVISAYAEASRTVPIFAFVLRRAVGAGSVLMYGADTIFALPGYEMLAMGGDAVRALAASLGEDEGDAPERAAPVTVVPPHEARRVLVSALENARDVVVAAPRERKLCLVPL